MPQNPPSTKPARPECPAQTMLAPRPRRRSTAPFLGECIAVATFFFALVAVPSLSASAADPEPAAVASSIDTPGATAAAPVEVVLVLDNSGSMRTHDPDFLTRKAVLAFAEALAARGVEQGFEARVGVVLFDEDVDLALPLTPLSPASAATLLGPALAALDYSGQLTRSADAVERALYALRTDGERSAARQAIVLLTDGKLDTGDPGRDYDAATWLREDLAGESRERGIRIFGLAFTDRADYQLIQAIARKTGADYYRAARAEELAPITESVLARLTTADPGPPLAKTDASAAPGEGPPAATPSVSAAPIAGASDTPAFERLGWLPVLVLLLATGGFVGLRARARERAAGSGALASDPALRTDLPPAQLLDVGGVLGETGRAIPLQPGRTRIGRDPNNDIVIADDTISSEHAVIELVAGRYWLEDLRSTNGTKHGDGRLGRGERVVLKGGDHVRFADVDLMFVFAGYVPGGATVLLPSTSAPPSYWQASRPGASARLEALERSERHAAELALPHAVELPVDPLEPGTDLDPAIAPIAAEPLPESGTAASFASGAEPPSDPVTMPEAGESTRPDGAGANPAAGDPASELYRECLDYHLTRVAELSPAFAQFVERAFDEEMREAMRVAAGELVQSAQREDRLAKRAYTRDRIRYVLCGAPGGMDAAAEAYRTAHGGFTRFLSEEISSETFRADRCELVAVLTFGRAAGAPWVSLSVVPDDGQDPRIDLLSYELLTDAERRAIEPQTQREVSQTGRA
ncbi:MAG: VWA domain-containing protein [Deltaproteobacteria bacterium]|nr:VWA domain-containing protein [Deltaproteobacteria bacterium]